jgi:hypothetical protein
MSTQDAWSMVRQRFAYEDLLDHRDLRRDTALQVAVERNRPERKGVYYIVDIATLA